MKKKLKEPTKTDKVLDKIDKIFELYPVRYETVKIPVPSDYPLDDVDDESPYSSDVGLSGYKPWRR